MTDPADIVLQPDRSEFDPSLLDEIRSLSPGDPSLVFDLIDTFLEDLPVRLTELQAAVDKSDADLIHRAAHTIKGSSSNMGLIGVSSVASKMCEIARGGDAASAVAMVDDLLIAAERGVGIMKGQRAA